MRKTSFGIKEKIARTENKTWLTLILHAAFVFAFIAMSRASFAANCVSSFSIDVSGKAEVCPVSGATANVSTAGTIGVPVSCPDAGNYVYHDYGGNGSSSQSGGGSGAPGQPSTIKTGNPCECKKDCEQPDGCNNDNQWGIEMYCIGGKCTDLPPDLNACRTYVCEPGTGIVLKKRNDGDSCDDSTFCTSHDGEWTGSDQCLNGECAGRQIDLTRFNYSEEGDGYYEFPEVILDAFGGPILEIPSLMYRTDRKISKERVCCENEAKIVYNAEILDHASGWDNQVLGMGEFIDKLCTAVTGLADEYKDCTGFLKASTSPVELFHESTINKDCCSSVVDAEGAGYLRMDQTNLSGDISFTLFGSDVHSEVQGIIDLYRSFYIDGTTIEHQVLLGEMRMTYTFTYLGMSYSPEVAYENVSRSVSVVLPEFFCSE